MRDEIFKRAATPREVRTWAKRSARPADVRKGRARDALVQVVRSEFKREISKAFLKWFEQVWTAHDAQRLLIDPIAFFESQSECGGTLEHEVRNAVLAQLRRDQQAGEKLEPLVVDALFQAIRNRLESYIREFHVQCGPDRSSEARRMLRQMREDSSEPELRSFVRKLLVDSQFRKGRPETPSFSPEEDLTGCSSSKEAPHE